MKKTRWTYTAGTERTGQYQTVCSTSRGKLAFRGPGGSVPDGYVRIRVEPVRSTKVVARVAEMLGSERGWKQPGEGGQHRFSKVVSVKLLSLTLVTAKVALGVGRLKCRQNPTANRKAKVLAQSQA